ncbi:GNAT family N-acetyltransferase [Qaidamihabitans albus]|uniref:GNAT family N-acetyltransferase n=1 Tax=Qaidamihabitans albus TaxID=2795733 RepID=UPI0018F13927|nr:GNAT family N-acetyltransferase [Qaidamihabitans albus]
MEPVEINAGGYYLRQLRADELMDDRPAMLRAFADPEMRRFVPDIVLATLADADAYVALRARQWEHGERCSWAVAEPTTGDLLGEVGLKNLDLGTHIAASAEAAVWVHPAARGRGVAATALGAALRFGFGALGLHVVRYRHHRDNEVSAAVARRCGFRYRGPVGPDDEEWTRGPEPAS